MTQSIDSFGTWLNLGTLVLTKEYQRSFPSIGSNNRYRITYIYNPTVLKQYQVKGLKIYIRNVISDGVNELFTPPIVLYPKEVKEMIAFPLDKDISFTENDLISKFIEAKYYYKYNVLLPNNIGSLCNLKIEVLT